MKNDPKLHDATHSIENKVIANNATQNIYDDQSFFDGYRTLPRSVEGLAAAGEWESLRAMLAAVEGRSVVDLGCGYGWFCRWAAEAGASQVLGLDVSEKMLQQATADTDDATIMYRRSDLETLELPTGKFDLVYSSLTFHYLHNLPSVLRTVERALVPGGIVAFSVEHLIFTAPSSAGFVRNGDGHWSWPVDQYLVEGPRTTNWFVDGVVKQHRTIGTYVTLLLQAGLVLAHLDEWGPTDEQIEQHPNWAIERERPPFLLMVGRKPG